MCPTVNQGRVPDVPQLRYCAFFLMDEPVQSHMLTLHAIATGDMDAPGSSNVFEHEADVEEGWSNHRQGR